MTNFDRACSLLFGIIFLVSKRVYAFNQLIAIFETLRFKCTLLFIFDRSSWAHRSFQLKTRVRSKLTTVITIERNCKSLIRSLNSSFQTLDEIFVLTHIFRGKLRKRYNDRTTSYWCSTSTFVSLASQSRRTFYYEEHASSVNTSIRLINAHNPNGSTFLNVYLPRFNNFIFFSYRPLCFFRGSFNFFEKRIIRRSFRRKCTWERTIAISFISSPFHGPILSVQSFHLSFILLHLPVPYIRRGYKVT